MSTPRAITVIPVTGLGEVRPGDDLAALLTRAGDVRDGDVLVVTSKVVSKAEGRVVTVGADLDRAAALAAETDRVVARRGGTSIVRTHHGLVMAAAGIDASNTEPGTLVLLPEDPDRSARDLREALRTAAAGGDREGPNVGVVVSDTSGRAWRNGQTDIAVGAAGIVVLDDHAGRVDGYGNALAVTAPAVADEIAAAADLATGKLGRAPAAVVRGLRHLLLPPGEDGPGAAALVRPEATDMFGLGSHEAVLAALTRRDRRGFGAPVPAADLVEALGALLPGARLDAAGTDSVLVEVPVPAEVGGGVVADRAAALAHALGWTWDEGLADAPAESARARLRFITRDP